jgi:hypothetical protein
MYVDQKTAMTRLQLRICSPSGFDSAISVLECLDDCAETTETRTAAGRIADLLMSQFVNRLSTLLYMKIAVLRRMSLVSCFVWVNFFIWCNSGPPPPPPGGPGPPHSPDFYITLNDVPQSV